MSYRLDEIQGFLLDTDNHINADLDDELYETVWDIFCSCYGGKETLELPEFEYNGKVYPAKTFNFTKKGEEILDDYCEGKTQYHYNIKLTDNDTGDEYQIFTDYYNDDLRGISITYTEPRKVKIKGEVIEQCCDNMKIVSVSGKCNDTFSYKSINDKNWKKGSPYELKLGDTDYIEFTFCKSCGKIHFK